MKLRTRSDEADLADLVERAKNRLALQDNPALRAARSDEELAKEAQVEAYARKMTRQERVGSIRHGARLRRQRRSAERAIAKSTNRDQIDAHNALVAQRREHSPAAKLAALYRQRKWSLRVLAGVVVAGMVFSAVNVQHNLAPSGPSDPLYWVSYLLEAMISACLVVIMVGSNAVAEWGVNNNKNQVVTAELTLLGLSIGLNCYPYVSPLQLNKLLPNSIAPVMIGIALLIHNAVSERYGVAIQRASAAMGPVELHDLSSVDSLTLADADSPMDLEATATTPIPSAGRVQLPEAEVPVDFSVAQPLRAEGRTDEMSAPVSADIQVDHSAALPSYDTADAAQNSAATPVVAPAGDERAVEARHEEAAPDAFGVTDPSGVDMNVETDGVGSEVVAAQHEGSTEEQPAPAEDRSHGTEAAPTGSAARTLSTLSRVQPERAVQPAAPIKHASRSTKPPRPVGSPAGASRVSVVRGTLAVVPNEVEDEVDRAVTLICRTGRRSPDLVKTVLTLKLEGESNLQIAEKMKCDEASVRRIVKSAKPHLPNLN
ncbi:hypothetical protein [Nocardia sp. XZ_19_231]|uniref:hypothetical protein n=1 Tax=Nocardia sp. XZ_19_231 TaxID=2769252 RepID=UPI00188E8D0D|nr:hypothetical protein [Nocardia sp. XZ_19_231]